MPVIQKITKTIKTFFINGQMYEGSIADYYEGRAVPLRQGKEDDLVRTGDADSLPKESGEAETN